MTSLFQRNAALVALGDVKKGARVRPNQPFVGGERHEVRIEHDGAVEIRHGELVVAVGAIVKINGR